MKVEVSITKEDIERGKPRSQCLCPIALALNKMINKESSVRATEFFIWGDKLHISVLPAIAKSFIQDFDEGIKVEPMSFEADIPEEYLKLS